MAGPTHSATISAEPPKTAAGRSTVFIVDDHTMFREGLRQLIEHDAGLTVSGDVPDAPAALDAIRRSPPDVVLVDITLADSNGLELVKTLRTEFEDLPILVVSMHEESLYAERALRAGAMGYVMKNEPGKTVTAAIHTVLRGEMYLSRKMSSSVISRFMHGQDEQPLSPLEILSDRELEVFRMLGQGKAPVKLTKNSILPSLPSSHSGIELRKNCI